MRTSSPHNEARRRAKADSQAIIDAASLELERGAIDELAWHERVTGALAAAYLINHDPRWQSGFDGDAELWREARELVLDAVNSDGTFLDIGCANGHLIECLATWALERGWHLLYGLELNRDLASAARRRIPAWADRIFEGNVVDWAPPRLFTYVRTGEEYVPPDRRLFLVARLLSDVVEPGGRLIVGPVYGSAFDDAVAVLAEAGFADVVVQGATDRNGKTRYVLWVAKPQSESN